MLSITNLRMLSIAMALALSLFMTSSARSQFSGCDASVLDNFEQRDVRGRITWAVPDMECVEFFSFTFSTPHGERQIRAVGDINADTFLPPRGLEAIETAARQSATKMADLGDYDIPNVTILVTAALPDDAELEVRSDGTTWRHSDTAADANQNPVASNGICPVRYFSVNGMTDVGIRFSLAHELFHCVQFASLRQDQTRSNPLWMMEGSAELFAGYAFPRDAPVYSVRDQFREDVVAQKPIYEMEYSAAFVFLWHYEQNGIAALMPLLHTMASTSDAAAQRRVLRGMFTPEQWLRFAQAVDDNAIHFPGGEAADFGNRVDGQTWAITSTASYNQILRPFVITPGWANYECGMWGNAVTPRGANIAAHVEGERAWAAWPAETDCRERRSVRYRRMAMHTGDANTTLTLRANQRIACQGCLTSAAVIDSCLVGTWQQTGGGPTEWLRRNGAPITLEMAGRMRMTMRNDGTMTTEPMDVEAQISVRERRGSAVHQSRGSVASMAGRWSAEHGQLRMCIDSGGQAAGTNRSTYSDGSVNSSPFGFNGGTGGTARYTCSGNSLRTIIAMPRGSEMVTEYTRVSVTPLR